ncbi:MAG TPA: helix-turn-helix domain-containing protein [Gammaproteobacteria bacterium]|jgi:HTH-type transcriptional regulator/antitoxin HigA|nr:helix-turn-helix domain-containing protein [Gammaproteobacteria bacterium]
MATIRINNDLKNTIKHWKCIANDIREPLNNNDYEKLSTLLDRLLEIVGDDENHELIGLVDVISHMISLYDEKHNYQIKAVSGIKALKFLMEQHELTQADLPEVGSQGVVSEILNGKRDLNLKQIKKLSKRFHVSAETFID